MSVLILIMVVAGIWALALAWVALKIVITLLRVALAEERRNQ